MTLASTLKDSIKKLCARADVHVTHKKIGRALKKKWLLEYARDEQGLPPEIVDFYAELDGVNFTWRGNGIEGGTRDLARGQFELQKLDDLMWYEREGFELMRLDGQWDNLGLLLVREAGDIRVVYAPKVIRDELSGVTELGSFTEMIEGAIARAFLPCALIGSPVLDTVRAALARPPTKRKVGVGSRVFGAKVTTDSFGLDRRGRVAELVKGNNGTRYALVDWDHGDRSYTRVNLLAVLAEDAYERARADGLLELAPEERAGLLDQFSNNSAGALYRDADPDQPVRLSCDSTLWMTGASVSTPLPEYIRWVETQLDELAQPGSEAEKVEDRYHDGVLDMPLTGIFSGSYLHLFTTGFDPQRRVRALVEAAALRWLRDPEAVEREQLLELLARVPWEAREDDDDPTLASSLRAGETLDGLAAVPRFDDSFEKARALGLEDWPVYYMHD